MNRPLIVGAGLVLAGPGPADASVGLVGAVHRRLAITIPTTRLAVGAGLPGTTPRRRGEFVALERSNTLGVMFTQLANPAQRDASRRIVRLITDEPN